MERVENWNIADKDGNINIPDYLDDMYNKVGMQLGFHSISGKNSAQTAVDIVHGAEKFFINRYGKDIVKFLELISNSKGEIITERHCIESLGLLKKLNKKF